MRKRLAVWALLLVLTLGRAVAGSTAVYFSPGVRAQLLPLLAGVQRSMDLAVYAFTDSDLAWAVVKAQGRGVKVRVVLDGPWSANRYAKDEFLARHGVEVRLDGGGGIMHHKFAVLDERKVVTGSYNWTASAEEENHENVLILDDPAVAAQYAAEFQRLWAGAQPHVAPEPAPPPTAPFIGNANSKKLHRKGCPAVEQMAPEHAVLFATKEEALKKGYSACGRCKP